MQRRSTSSRTWSGTRRKLRRLSALTQEAVKHVACLGNVTEIATLTLVLGETEKAHNAALLEAVHAGLVFRHDNNYKFLHDRIQQAAYSLVPEERRAEVHLRIGRVLLASLTADQLAKHLFDVANQLDRGAGRLIDREEGAGGDDRSACRAKGQGGGGLCVGVRVFFGRHGLARRSRLG
jgi:predicted ATPase